MADLDLRSVYDSLRAMCALAGRPYQQRDRNLYAPVLGSVGLTEDLVTAAHRCLDALDGLQPGRHADRQDLPAEYLVALDAAQMGDPRLLDGLVRQLLRSQRVVHLARHASPHAIAPDGVACGHPGWRTQANSLRVSAVTCQPCLDAARLRRF